MKFSIIYEADAPMESYIDNVAPPKRHLWTLTEQADGQPSEWCEDIFGGKVKHRKWATILTKAEFVEFLRATGLTFEADTLGSLGAPGFGIGWAPALAYSGDDPDSIQSAYVTPLPEPVGCEEKTFSERDFDRIARVLKAGYGW